MNSEIDDVGKLKIGVVAVLLFIETISVKFDEDNQYRGLVLRELRGNPGTLIDRFNALMVEFETGFSLINLKKLAVNHVIMMNSIIKSWKKNGVSLTFNQDIQNILFTKEGIPTYIEQNEEILRFFKAMFEMIKQPK